MPPYSQSSHTGLGALPQPAGSARAHPPEYSSIFGGGGGAGGGLPGKIPRNKLTKKVKDLCLEKYTMLKNEVKEDTNKWKHVPCS